MPKVSMPAGYRVALLSAAASLLAPMADARPVTLQPL
jgi:hypothetical protein